MTLKELYNDKVYSELKEFVLEHLREKAIELTFSGQETQHVKLALEVIEDTWTTLDREFGNKKKAEVINKAR